MACWVELGLAAGDGGGVHVFVKLFGGEADARGVVVGLVSMKQSGKSPKMGVSRCLVASFVEMCVIGREQQ